MKTIKKYLPRRLVRAYALECQKETHINRALRGFRGDAVYVEIGIRDGACLRQIKADRKAGVDPAPVLAGQALDGQTTVFPMFSDDFFKTNCDAWLAGEKINVALVDGLHEFEQCLRDLFNLERHMSRDGVVFIHDCNPPTRKHAEDMNGPWNGDVWKVLVFLARHRPELRYHTLDCDWGLGVVTGFGAAPCEPKTADVLAIKQLDYSHLEASRRAILRLRRPVTEIRNLAAKSILRGLGLSSTSL